METELKPGDKVKLLYKLQPSKGFCIPAGTLGVITYVDPNNTGGIGPLLVKFPQLDKEITMYRAGVEKVDDGSYD